MTEKEILRDWKKSSIKIGTPTNIIAAFTAFIPIIWMCIKYDCWPDIGTVMTAWGMVAASFGAFYLVEPISYYASLGLTGTYLSFLSGNIGNMRVPCAAMALDITDSKPGTIKAEIVSTMAICGSIVTNLIGTTLAVIVGSFILQKLPTTVQVGLATYAAPAIFGATFGNFAIKYPQIAVPAILIPLLVLKFLSFPPALVIVISVFGTLFIARVMYKKGIVKA